MPWVTAFGEGEQTLGARMRWERPERGAYEPPGGYAYGSASAVCATDGQAFLRTRGGTETICWADRSRTTPINQWPAGSHDFNGYLYFPDGSMRVR